MLTEDRKGQGLAMLMDVATNISAPDLQGVSRSGWLDRGRETAIAEAEIANYRIACRGPGCPEFDDVDGRPFTAAAGEQVARVELGGGLGEALVALTAAVDLGVRYGRA